MQLHSLGTHHYWLFLCLCQNGMEQRLKATPSLLLLTEVATRRLHIVSVIPNCWYFLGTSLIFCILASFPECCQSLLRIERFLYSLQLSNWTTYILKYTWIGINPHLHQRLKLFLLTSCSQDWMDPVDYHLFLLLRKWGPQNHPHCLMALSGLVLWIFITNHNSVQGFCAYVFLLNNWSSIICRNKQS